MADFIGKYSDFTSSSLLTSTLNGIQSSNNEIYDLQENTAKINDHIIPSTTNLFTIGNTENKYVTAYITNVVYTNNIYNPDTLNITATSSVEIYGNLLINTKRIVDSFSHINFEKSIFVNKVGMISVKKHCIVVNSDINLLENDSSASLFIQKSSSDNTITILLENDQQNNGYKFESIFIENADADESYSYMFTSQKNISGKLYNLSDNDNLEISGTYNGLTISNYSLGDKISFKYTGSYWLITGIVKNIDNIILV